jgi:hypothetical protein
VLFGLDQPVFSGLIKITIVGKQKSKIVLIIWLAYFFTKHFKTKVLITFLHTSYCLIEVVTKAGLTVFRIEII